MIRNREKKGRELMNDKQGSSDESLRALAALVQKAVKEESHLYILEQVRAVARDEAARHVRLNTFICICAGIFSGWVVWG